MPQAEIVISPTRVVPLLDKASVSFGETEQPLLITPVCSVTGVQLKNICYES